MNIVKLIGLSALISACAASPSQAGYTAYGNAQLVPLGDGTSGWELTCGASIGDCFRRADQVCPSGFETVHTSQQQTGGVVIQNPGMPVGQVINSNTGSLIVKCTPTNAESK